MLVKGATGLILSMYTANKGRRFNVTLSLIGWAYTQNGPYYMRVMVYTEFE